MSSGTSLGETMEEDEEGEDDDDEHDEDEGDGDNLKHKAPSRQYVIWGCSVNPASYARSIRSRLSQSAQSTGNR